MPAFTAWPIDEPTTEPVMDHPHNELESAMVASTIDEAARPRFYETLLISKPS